MSERSQVLRGFTKFVVYFARNLKKTGAWWAGPYEVFLLFKSMEIWFKLNKISRNTSLYHFQPANDFYWQFGSCFTYLNEKGPRNFWIKLENSGHSDTTEIAKKHQRTHTISFDEFLSIWKRRKACKIDLHIPYSREF